MIDSLIQTIFLVGGLSIFVVVTAASFLLSEEAIENGIKKELGKYGCKLISINNTKEKYTPTEKSPDPGWRKHVRVDFSRPKRTRYKKISFSTPHNNIVQSLVAIDIFLNMSYKFYFEIELDRL